MINLDIKKKISTIKIINLNIKIFVEKIIIALVFQINNYDI